MARFDRLDYEKSITSKKSWNQIDSTWTTQPM